MILRETSPEEHALNSISQCHTQSLVVVLLLHISLLPPNEKAARR